jgi:hypothetical protein
MAITVGSIQTTAFIGTIDYYLLIRLHNLEVEYSLIVFNKLVSSQ